jgi:hypothetical protein
MTEQKRIEHFHMSEAPVAPRKILRGNGRDKVQPEVEHELEIRRPPDKLSRRMAVFTVLVPDFRFFGMEGGYIHRVAIVPPGQMHDTFWLGKLQTSFIRKKYNLTQSPMPVWTPELIDDLCQKYWSGAVSEKPVWECLTHEATVLELLCHRSQPISLGTNSATFPYHFDSRHL